MKTAFFTILARFVFTLALVCGLYWPARASSLPLGDIFSHMPGANWEAVRDAASAQTTSAPYYKSNAIERRTYQGFFKASDATTKLAIFSDDGCDVYINGQRVHNRLKTGQSLPDLSKSLFALSSTFAAGHVYSVRVEFSNTHLTGDTDIDGVTLFCYEGGGEIVSLSVTASSDETEICAGGIADAAHQTQIKAVVKDSSNATVANIPVTFSVENSHAQYPAALSATAATTNSAGEAIITLNSSRKISAKAKVKADIGGTHSTTPEISMQDAEEQWSISPDSLEADGHSQATVKLTLKYKGQPVTGHQNTWRINRIWDDDDDEIYNAGANTGSSIGYGALSPSSSVTDVSGAITTTYTVGTATGIIEFAALDYTVVANSPKSLSL